MMHYNPFVSLAQTQLASRLVPFWGVSEAPRLFQASSVSEYWNESPSYDLYHKDVPTGLQQPRATRTQGAEIA